jgi:hypothetical protein
MTDESARAIVAHLSAYFADHYASPPGITIDPGPAREQQVGPTIRIGPAKGEHIAITESFALNPARSMLTRLFIVSNPAEEYICGPDPVQAASCAIFNYALMRYKEWLDAADGARTIAVDQPREWAAGSVNPRDMPADLRAAAPARPIVKPERAKPRAGKRRRDN